MEDPTSWTGDATWWLIMLVLLALAVRSVRMTARQIADDLNLPPWAATVSTKLLALIAAVALGVACSTLIGTSEHWPIGVVVGLAVVELGDVVYKKVVSFFARLR